MFARPKQPAVRTASDRPVDDLVIGTAFDLRGITGLSTSETVGCFSTVLPVRCNVTDVKDGSFEGLASRMHDVCRSAFRHPDVPLMGIIERLSPPRRAWQISPYARRVIDTHFEPSFLAIIDVARNLHAVQQALVTY